MEDALHGERRTGMQQYAPTETTFNPGFEAKQMMKLMRISAPDSVRNAQRTLQSTFKLCALLFTLSVPVV